MAYPSPFQRLTSYFADGNAGMVFDADFWADLDSELNNIVTSLSGQLALLQSITSASGQLTGVSAATAMSLVATQRVVAGSAGQTVFNTTIPWNAAFTSYNVTVTRVLSGDTVGPMFDPSQYAIASDGGGTPYLKITLTPTDTASGDVIVVSAFSAGAGVLNRLALTTTANGASLIGIEDSGGLYSATTVEGALEEIRTTYNALVAALGTTANIWYKTGLTSAGGAISATGNWNMGGNKLTNLVAGSASGDSATVGQLQAATQGFLDLAAYFLRSDVTIPWGIAQNANGRILNNLVMTDSPGTVASEAANQEYVDGYVAAAIAPIQAELSGVVAGNVGNLYRLTRFVTFITAQTNTTWTFPVGTSLVLVEAWGGGSAGVSQFSGPSGGYVKAYIGLNVAPATPVETSLQITVGAGAPASSSDGGASTVALGSSPSTLLLSAGGGLIAGTGGLAEVFSVAGGVITLQAELINGADTDYSIQSGGPGRDAPRGGGGGRHDPGTGYAGKAPGGGGGARNWDSVGYAAGGVGRITITY